jgi:hypothetical protein
VGGVFARLRAFGRRHRAITVLGSLATAAALVLVLAGRGHEFETALWSAAPWMLALTALLQIVALVARSEAWHLDDRGRRRDGRPPRALLRVEHAGGAA